MAEHNERERAEVLREIFVMSAVCHPNIIRYHQSFATADTVHIVIEYASGGTLKDKLNNNGRRIIMKEAKALKYYAQVALALAHLHEASILHRDLKAENILLTADGTVKVADFGVSRLLDSTAAVMTRAGTPHYVAPEIVKGAAYNAKCDVWSSGVILFECLVGKMPFSSAKGVPHLLRNITTEPHHVPSRVSRPVRRLIDALLSKKPSRRPTSADVLTNELVATAVDRLEQQLRAAHNTSASRSADEHDEDAAAKEDARLARGQRDVRKLSKKLRVSRKHLRDVTNRRMASGRRDFEEACSGSAS